MFLNGAYPGLPDYIFFGNFMWVEKCSDKNLFENNPNIKNWFCNLKNLNDIF